MKECLVRNQNVIYVLFRQMEKGNLEHPPADLERAFDSPEEFACKVGGCAIRGQHLLDYIFAAGNAQSRETIDSVVAPSCLMVDVLTPLDEFRSQSINELGIDPLGDTSDPQRKPPQE